MTFTLSSCTERPARADIDPMLAEFYEEIQPKLQALDYPPLDIPFWIEDFWHHAEQYLPPAGSTWIARNAARLAVGWGTMRRICPDMGTKRRFEACPGSLKSLQRALAESLRCGAQDAD